MNLLNRYQSGEYNAVWSEIRRISNHEACQDQVIVDVAKATMERVEHNVELLANRLRKFGWRALGAEYSDLRTKPSPDDESIFDRISKISGEPIPVSFDAFWRTVGGINLVWDYQLDEDCPDLGFDIPLEEMDPLCIDPPQATAYQLDEWESGEHHLLTGLAGKYRLDLAPDYLHKANISGGDAYAIYFPSTASDPIFENERHRLPFVDYLRLAFKWVGFPDLEKHQHHPEVQGFIKEFRDGLIDF